jgi:hypothetical protein
MAQHDPTPDECAHGSHRRVKLGLNLPETLMTLHREEDPLPS